MNYETYDSISSREQASYVAQCRTLVRALTSIEAEISFQEFDAPARVYLQKSYGDAPATVEVNSKMPLAAIAGLIIHESGHVLATDAKAYAEIAKACEGESTVYINMVEDYRINVGVIGRYFPWAVRYIYETESILQQLAPHKLGLPSNIVNAMFHNVVVHDADCNPTMLQDAQQYVTQWGPSIVAALNTCDLKDAALALEALDKKHGKTQDPKPQSDEEQERQEKVYGVASEELDKKAEANSGDKPEQKEGRKKNKHQATPYSSHGPEDSFYLQPANNQQAGFTRAISLLSAMRNRLHDAIVADDLGAPQRHLKKGQLDCRRVAYATATDSVFMSPHAQRKRVNTAIDVVIDCSHSMDHSDRDDGISRAHIAAATAYMLGSALARVEGAHVGVLLYNCGVKRMSPIAPMRGITKKKAALWANAGGGTNTDLALDYSLRDLLAARSVTRRISLIITDDEAAEQENIDAARRLGVEAYCLCIASRRRTSTENIKHCKDAGELPGVVAELVKTIAAAAR
jgi:hypothetical protein